MFAAPDSFAVVHSCRYFIDTETFSPLGTDGPRALAEAPVIVLFIGTASEKFGCGNADVVRANDSVVSWWVSGRLTVETGRCG